MSSAANAPPCVCLLAFLRVLHMGCFCRYDFLGLHQKPSHNIMKKTPLSILLALALIAPYAVSMPISGTFTSINSSVQILASKEERKAKKPRKSKAKKGGGVTFHDGSAESRSERDRRLSRECKGRSNSGVCEGYTR